MMPRGNQENSVRFIWGEQSIEKGTINVSEYITGRGVSNVLANFV